MQLSREAEKLYTQLLSVDTMSLENQPDFWKRKMKKMPREKAQFFFELFEELEAAGAIVMCVEEIEDGFVIPKKVRVREGDWE